jgi:3-deoxy-D-manno-octulosonic-acid transferase
MSQRLGIYGAHARAISGTPRIWIHAVSVGEVTVAGAIIQALKKRMPHCVIILSTTTAHGQAVAVEKLAAQAVCLYAPIDFILSVQNALSVLKPDILVCLETEIWPNWLMAAHRMGIKTALINGRLSVRSIKRYRKIRPLMKEIFTTLDAFSMIHAEDAKRIQQLGAPLQNISVGGNAKYDLLRAATETATADAMKKLYRVTPDQPVLVAGSTRGAEGDLVLAVFQKIIAQFPQALLIIAPRHLKRVPEISERARHLGFSCQLRTRLNETNAPRTASVVIIDTIGELQAIYGIASVVFCGGSLVPLGGQNILEAAVWGKPVIYGPSMDDFRDARELLESTGGGIQVANEVELAEKVADYFSRPDMAAGIGFRAKQAVLSQSGAADRHAAVIYRLLSNS